MKKAIIPSVLAATILLLGVAIGVEAENDCSAVLPELPPSVAAAKAEIIRLTQNNLDKWGDPDFQIVVDEQADILEEWFILNRPDNEVELTKKAWFATWYEDTSFIFDQIDRTNTFQIVRDGFYYNLSRIEFVFLFFLTFSFTNFLRGQFSIVDPKDETTCGLTRRNVIALEFTDNNLKIGFPSTDKSLTELIDDVESGDAKKGFPIPGPQGNTGFLWNKFIDEDLRVAFGTDDTGVGGLFVLIAQDFVNPEP